MASRSAPHLPLSRTERYTVRSISPAALFICAGWLPDRSETVKLSGPHRGQGELSRLHLWIVPADVRGTWRGAGGQVRIEQSYNRIEVEGARNASITGREVRWDGFKGRVEGNRIVGELAGRPVELERR